MLRDRIAELLEELALSPRELAEKLGVQRSGISHILSGRNKPSLDFITRLTEAYPQIRHAWLLHGTGPMFETDRPSPPFQLPQSTALTAAQKRAPNPTSEKHVESIVVFYSDGTFKTYAPDDAKRIVPASNPGS